MIAFLASEVIAVVLGGFAVAACVGRVAHNIWRWACRMEKMIAYTESEMRENGGATTRDAIARIERHLARGGN